MFSSANRHPSGLVFVLELVLCTSTQGRSEGINANKFNATVAESMATRSPKTSLRTASDTRDSAESPSRTPLEKSIAIFLENAPSKGLEEGLDIIMARRRARVSATLVEDVLKVCYNSSVGLAISSFLGWARSRMTEGLSQYAWTLIVGLLGKNRQFSEMWKCIQAMAAERVISIDPFTTVFDCYSSAGMPSDAIGTFQVIHQYGCPKDVIALDCLLGALCRHGHTAIAADFLKRIKDEIFPDIDSYALLLEGWGKEQNVDMALQTFWELIDCLGWHPANTASYNALLNILVKGGRMEDATNVLSVMLKNKCIPDFWFFRASLVTSCQCNDVKTAFGFLNIMMQIARGTGEFPDTNTCNLFMEVLCKLRDIDYAFDLLEEMVYNGSFPDGKTYNIILDAVVFSKRVAEASSIFREMTRNEFWPAYGNYVLAIQMYFNAGDPEMATSMWKHMIEKKVVPKADCAALFINGLLDCGRRSEARKYCEEALSKGVDVPADTMSKLRQAMQNAGKQNLYEKLENKWRSSLQQSA